MLCRHDRPVLVLWPESASPYAWSFSAAYRERVVALCRELDIAILLSTVWSDAPDDPDAPFYNAAVLVTKDGARRARRTSSSASCPSASTCRSPASSGGSGPSAARCLRPSLPAHGTTLLSLGTWKLGRRRLLRGRLPLDRAGGDPRGSGRPLHAHERRVVRARRRAAAALAVGRRARDRDGPPARARGDHRASAAPSTRRAASS